MTMSQIHRPTQRLQAAPEFATTALGDEALRTRDANPRRGDAPPPAQSVSAVKRAEIQSAVAAVAGSQAHWVQVVDAATFGNQMKIALASTHYGLDPIAACVGTGGKRAADIESRLGAVVEFIEFDPDPARSVAAALNVPVLAVHVNTADTPPTATAIVEPHVHGRAVGAAGANTHMASALTGLRVTICSAACTSTTHDHTGGLRSGLPRPTATLSKPRTATPAIRGSLKLPPMPVHVRHERANRRRSRQR